MTIQEFEEWFKKANQKFYDENGCGLVIGHEYKDFYILSVDDMDDPLEGAETVEELVALWDDFHK